MSVIGHLLNRPCTIKRISHSGWTAAGGLTTAESAPENQVCRVVPLSLSEQELLGRLRIKATHAVYFDPGVDVNRGDKVWVIDNDPPRDEMTVASVEVPSLTQAYRKVYANCEQQRYEMA